MSLAITGLLVIPAGLVVGVLALPFAAARGAVSLWKACENELERRRSQRDRREAIAEVEDILAVAAQVRAGQLVHEAYSACKEALEGLKGAGQGVSAPKQLESQAQTLIQNAQEMLREATQEAERQALVRISLQYLAAKGCEVETRVSEDGEVVTILGVRSGKEMTVAIDKENHVLADFSKGYAEYAAGTCDRDLAAYVSALQNMGVGLKTDHRVHKTPTRRSKDAKQIPRTRDTAADPSVR